MKKVGAWLYERPSTCPIFMLYSKYATFSGIGGACRIPWAKAAMAKVIAAMTAVILFIISLGVDTL